MAESLAVDLYGRDQAQAIARLGLEEANFAAAFETFVARDEVSAALRLSVALEWYRYRTGRFGESRKSLERALALVGTDTSAETDLGSLKADAMVSLAWITFTQGDLEKARGYYERGIEASRRVGDRACEARGLTGLGVTVRWLGERAAGLAHSTEGVAVARSTVDKITLVYALIWAYATLDGIFDGKPPQAELEEALELAHGFGDEWAEAHILDGIGDLLRAQGNHEEARDCYEKSLALFLKHGDRWLAASVMDGMAKNELSASCPGKAVGHFRECLATVAFFGGHPYCGEIFAWLALIAAESGDESRAARLFGGFSATAMKADAEVLLSRNPRMANFFERLRASRREDFEAGNRAPFEESLALALS